MLAVVERPGQWTRHHGDRRGTGCSEILGGIVKLVLVLVKLDAQDSEGIREYKATASTLVMVKVMVMVMDSVRTGFDAGEDTGTAKMEKQLEDQG